MTALLECRSVEVAYDQVQVLFGVDLHVDPGETIALLGTNGAGKSTLLKAVSGVVAPGHGSITFDGRDITGAGPVAIARLGIVQMPGGKAVFPSLTVAEHLELAGWLQGRDRSAAAARARVLDLFPRLRERIGHQAGNLSGGEQQMLGLAMALVARPKLLLIDELSLGLAPAIVEQLLGIVRQVQDDGVAVVLVEQSVNVALDIAQRAYFLEKGEVRFEGATADLIDRHDILRAVFLSGHTNGRGGATTAAPARPAAPGGGPASEPILEIAGLTKRFGGITAVDGVTFSVGRRETLGLIGHNGAGKTTLFDVVSGFLRPDAGTVRLAGDDITRWTPPRRSVAGLGRSFQDARIFPSLTVVENIALALERHLDVRDHLAAAMRLPAVQDLEDDIAWTVADLIELMHLGAYRHKLAGELSTGTRRIVDLAMVVAHRPSVLLLDEPSSGIAQREAEALGPLLRRIQAETGCSLLVIEHDMPLIQEISDRLVALETGRVIAAGAPADVVADPRVVASYLGGDSAAVRRSGVVAPARNGKRSRPLVAPGRSGEEDR